MKRALLVFLLAAAAVALGEDTLSGPLQDGLPTGWRHVTFDGKRPTAYAIVTSGNTPVLRAFCNGTASFVARRVTQAGERLHWKWKVDRTIFAGDGKSKDTDDFAARICVGFEGSWEDASWSDQKKARKLQEEFGFPPPTHWIHYVWAGRGRARGEGFDEPYSPERFKCLALRSARDEIGVWYDEERDPRADFKLLYGREATKITAIAVMTDGDDTGSRAEAFYSEIEFVSSASR